MTRGLVRSRRAGLSRRSRRRRNSSQPGLSRAGASGGKSARLGDGGSGDPQRGDEAEAVGISGVVGGGLAHEVADGVVAAQVAPDLLEYQVRGLGARHQDRKSTRQNSSHVSLTETVVRMT